MKMMVGYAMQLLTASNAVAKLAPRALEMDVRSDVRVDAGEVRRLQLDPGPGAQPDAFRGLHTHGLLGVRIQHQGRREEEQVPVRHRPHHG